MSLYKGNRFLHQNIHSRYKPLLVTVVSKDNVAYPVDKAVTQGITAYNFIGAALPSVDMGIFQEKNLVYKK